MRRNTAVILASTLASLALSGCESDSPSRGPTVASSGDYASTPAVDYSSRDRAGTGAGTMDDDGLARGGGPLDTPARNAQTPTAGVEPNASGEIGGGPTEGAQAAAMGDAESLATLTTVNNAEIAEGRFVRGRARDAEVRRFAGMMVTEHTRANARGAALGRRAGVRPAPGDTARQLQSEARYGLEQLRAQRGAELDRVYITHQIEEHRRVLDMIDRRMLPGAQNADVRNALQSEVRPMVSAHLDESRRILGRLTTGATGAEPGASPHGEHTTGATGPAR